LSIDRETLPDCLEVNAWVDDQEIMSINHKTRPIYGLQFHPESIASENGHELINQFLKIAGIV
jgi:anthranilate synthase component 2